MALMTACPACNTHFKVVPDQLRLHHGLVRCGSCDHVFDANKRLETLPDNFVLDPQPQTPAINLSANGWINKPAVKALVNPADLTVKSQQAWTDLIAPSYLEEQANKAHDTAQATAIEQTPAKAKQSASAQTLTEKPDTAKRRDKSARSPASQLKPAKAASAGDSAITATASTTSTTSTVKTAMLVALCVLAAIAALSQGLVAARYVLADSVPWSKPLLTQLCKPFKCALEPAAWLQPLNLDALSLNKLPRAASANLQAYQMLATVRNSSHLAVKAPDIELTISNGLGQVLSLRSLPAAALSTAGKTASVIAPNTDWLIDTTLLLDEQTVGYTARLVYLPSLPQ